MELSSFSENIVIERIERNGDFVELQINIDAIVPDYYEQLDKLLEPANKRRDALRDKYKALTAEVDRRKKELEDAAKGEDKDKTTKKPKNPKPLPSVLAMEKELAEIQREEYAARLTCPVRLPDGSLTALLKGWNITEKGQAIPPSLNNLLRLPPKTVQDIWERCIARAETVKKREDVEEGETSESTPNSSKGLRVVGQTG